MYIRGYNVSFQLRWHLGFDHILQTKTTRLLTWTEEVLKNLFSLIQSICPRQRPSAGLFVVSWKKAILWVVISRQPRHVNVMLLLLSFFLKPLYTSSSYAPFFSLSPILFPCKKKFRECALVAKLTLVLYTHFAFDFLASNNLLPCLSFSNFSKMRGTLR